MDDMKAYSDWKLRIVKQLYFMVESDFKLSYMWKLPEFSYSYLHIKTVKVQYNVLYKSFVAFQDIEQIIEEKNWYKILLFSLTGKIILDLMPYNWAKLNMPHPH